MDEQTFPKDPTQLTRKAPLWNPHYRGRRDRL